MEKKNMSNGENLGSRGDLLYRFQKLRACLDHGLIIIIWIIYKITIIRIMGYNNQSVLLNGL